MENWHYGLDLALTADRVWVQLYRRHPDHGVLVGEAWGMLRPSGEITDLWVRNQLMDAALELLSRHPNGWR